MVVLAAFDDHVDLDRVQAGVVGGVDAGQDGGDGEVDVVDGFEGGVVEGVQ